MELADESELNALLADGVKGLEMALCRRNGKLGVTLVRGPADESSQRLNCTKIDYFVIPNS